MQVGCKRSDGFRRRPEHATQDATGDEYPAMNRRARRRVGEACHQVGVGKQPGTLSRFQRNLLKWRVRREVGSVKRRQPPVQVNVVSTQELPIIRGLAADDVLEEKIEGSPEIRN